MPMHYYVITQICANGFLMMMMMILMNFLYCNGELIASEFVEILYLTENTINLSRLVRMKQRYLPKCCYKSFYERIEYYYSSCS